MELKKKLIEKYNSEKEKGIKRWYLQNDTIIKEKDNGYLIKYHYDYIEKSNTGFLNEYELDDIIDYLKCIYGIDEFDEKNLDSNIVLWSKGRNIYHNRWENLKLNDIYSEEDKVKDLLNSMSNEDLFITFNTYTCKNHQMNEDVKK